MLAVRGVVYGGAALLALGIGAAMLWGPGRGGPPDVQTVADLALKGSLVVLVVGLPVVTPASLSRRRFLSVGRWVVMAVLCGFVLFACGLLYDDAIHRDDYNPHFGSPRPRSRWSSQSPRSPVSGAVCSPRLSIRRASPKHRRNPSPLRPERAGRESFRLGLDLAYQDVPHLDVAKPSCEICKIISRISTICD